MKHVTSQSQSNYAFVLRYVNPSSGELVARFVHLCEIHSQTGEVVIAIF